MTFLSARRAVPAFVSVAALAALALPNVAAAKEEPKPDINTQCSGPAIQGEGSTFQGPAEFQLTGFNWETSKEQATGYNSSANEFACSGTQGTKEKPTVRYNQTNPLERGSGSCLKSFGVGVTTFGEEKEEKGAKDHYPRVHKFPYCGTDEAPSAAAKAEMEKFAESPSPIESIPFAQGALAVIINLPAGCTASSEPVVKTKLTPVTRLSLDQSTVEAIFRGTDRTWKSVIEAQGGHANNKLTCTGGEAEENQKIKIYPRADKSGTTHVFKKFLEQVNEAPFEAEKGTFACSSEKGVESKTWEQVSEGCENQRWPVATEIIRPKNSGNQGVIEEVGKNPSSLSYADLAVAREYEGGYFSGKAKKGGENKKGEANHAFWALVQNNKEKVEYQDPSSNKDVEKKANSNCAKTVYIAKVGEKVPPPSTLSDWSKVKGSIISVTYPICGLTYVIAPQLYFPYLTKYAGETAETSKAIATSAHDFIHWAVNAKAGGGGPTLKNTDYEKISGTVQKEAELGAEEIGNTIP